MFIGEKEREKEDGRKGDEVDVGRGDLIGL